MKNKLIVFIGSFNPITKAHINILQLTKQTLDIKDSIIVLTSNNYNKESLISFNHRYNMLNLLKDKYNYNISTYENSKPKQPKTITTLNHLQKLYPNTNLYLLIGADNFINFKNWYQPTNILKKYNLIVINRDNYNINNTLKESIYKDYINKITIINTNKDYSSSSLYRNNPIDNQHLIDNKVLKYIKEYQLY